MEFMNVCKALSDENRIRVIMALEGKELCVCQIIKFLGLAPSTVSKHMWLLKQAKIVQSRKEGRWIYYKLSGNKQCPNISVLLKWMFSSLSENDKIAADRKNLERIMKCDLEEICGRNKLPQGKSKFT